jgi:hypothetical protein
MELFMICSKVINTIGLAFDIAGAILIWRYGLPRFELRKDSVNYINLVSQSQEKEYDRWAKLGIVFLIIGFSLQLLSNWV